MKLTLKKDKRYTIAETHNSSWLRVEFRGKMLAIVMDMATARQVVYRDINDNSGECVYLHKEDFEETTDEDS